jgi:nucleotide-binding universal stress UspA family protein
VLCPVDYSACSRRALRYAGALASHFGARLLVLHVADPFLAGAVAIQQLDLLGNEGRHELQAFVERNLRPAPPRGFEPELVLGLGSPAREIVALAEARRADLIVMGSHGYTGARKAFFGSTAQQVLRQAPVPVLAVPLRDARDEEVAAPLVASGPVIAPVDFSAESCGAAHAAAGLARALDLPLVLLHVAADVTAAGAAELPLQRLSASLDYPRPIDDRIVCGNPGDEIARVASSERASVVVLSLASAERSPGQATGSVAYRVLSHTPSPILALPATPVGGIFVSHLHRDALI